MAETLPYRMDEIHLLRQDAGPVSLAHTLHYKKRNQDDQRHCVTFGGDSLAEVERRLQAALAHNAHTPAALPCSTIATIAAANSLPDRTAAPPSTGDLRSPLRATSNTDRCNLVFIAAKQFVASPPRKGPLAFQRLRFRLEVTVSTSRRVARERDGQPAIALKRLPMLSFDGFLPALILPLIAPELLS